MKRIYLVKRLDFKHGASLNAHVPYLAEKDEERELWLVRFHDEGPRFPVLPKFVEKVVDEEPVVA
jgi:hypothetical protein